MNELVTFKNSQAVTNSLLIAKNFDKSHKHVLESIENKIKSAENPADYNKMFYQDKYIDSRGRPQKMYYLNRDGFSFIAMSFTGKKADNFKLQYIKAFNQMEMTIKNDSYKVPKSFSDALRLAADQQAKIELMKPKVRFADAVSSSDTSILIGILAKILRQKNVNIGQNRLFEWMRTNGYLISRKGASFNTPTQLSMDLGLFDIKETTILHNDGHVTINKTTKVTGKGQQYFVNKFLGGDDDGDVSQDN